MNLFEAKNILKNNGFKLIKEAAGEVKVIFNFKIERTSAAICNPNNSAERRDYHILMSQIKKQEDKDKAATELKQTTDPNKLGGARMYNQRVKTKYKTSYIWINPEELNADLAKYNLRAKVEYSQVDTESNYGDDNPYYENGVDHLFPAELVGKSCPSCYITYSRDYQITVIGKSDDLLEYFGVNNMEELTDYLEGYPHEYPEEWTIAYTNICNASYSDKHPKVTENTAEVQIVDSTDDDDIETEEEEVKRIVP